MRLIRLIYASKATDSLTKDDIKEILTTAKANNHLLGISGMLCFDNKYFLQILEGSSEVVNELYHKIVRDQRHTDLRIISYNEIPFREFDKWSMKLFLANKENQNFVKKYSSSERFNPILMSGESCLLFLRAMAESSPNED